MILPKILRRIIRPILNILLQTWGKHISKRNSLNKSIILATIGRGGSTWLAELVSKVPGYPLLWEPTHLGTNPTCIKYGFNWNTYIREGEDEPLKKKYIEGVLNGSQLNNELVSSLYFNPIQYIFFRGFVIKFTTANLFLKWMLDLFPVKTVLMIRHPCAVVSSQLRHSAWSCITKDNITFPYKLKQDFPHFIKCFELIETPDEILAFEWAMQVYVPLAIKLPYPWYLIAYEWMAKDGINEIKKLFNYLELPLTNNIIEQYAFYSKTSEDQCNNVYMVKQLCKWKENLTNTQIQRIMKVVHNMGIDFYDNSDGPDLEKIKEFSNRASKRLIDKLDK